MSEGLLIVEIPEGGYPMGFQDLFHWRIVVTWLSPPSLASEGGGIRVVAGDKCPCGRGSACPAFSPIHGQFLGCTAYDNGHGCHRAWTLDGDRLPMTARRRP
jgi:hypothetical protein